MALTTVSEQIRKDPLRSYENGISGERKAQIVPTLVDSIIDEHALLEALGDKYTRMILLSVIDEPKSVIDVTKEQNIPISSAYRKIHWLEKSHLIGVKGFVITNEGKKYHLYQSRIKTMHVSLATNSIKIEITSNNGKMYNHSLQEQEIPIT
jgi:uncharacterized protein YjiK